MRSFAALTVLAALSRAPTLAAQSTPDPRLPGQERQVVVAGTTLRLRPSQDGFIDATIVAPAERVYEVLPLAFTDLGLVMKEIDQPNRQLGTGPFRAQSRLGKQRLSALLDCGLDPIGQRQADSYAVSLRVTTQVVRESEGRATVHTLVQATGRPRSNSGLDVHCPSTGRLEGMIAEAVAKRLLAPDTGAK